MSIASDEVTGKGIVVTIKYGKGYDETWAVFRGVAAEIREQLIDYFGLDRASVENLTTHELSVNATQVAHGVGAVASVLGGVVVGSKPGSDTRPDEGQANPWQRNGDKAEDKPAEDPNKHLRDAIEAAADRDALKRLWAENQEPFAADAELMAAWKAKGKSLGTGAAA